MDGLLENLKKNKMLWILWQAVRPHVSFYFLLINYIAAHFLAMVEALQMHDALAKFLQEGHNQDDVTVQGDTSFA